MTSIHELLNITTQSEYTHRYFCIKPSIEYDHSWRITTKRTPKTCINIS